MPRLSKLKLPKKQPKEEEGRGRRRKTASEEASKVFRSHGALRTAATGKTGKERKKFNEVVAKQRRAEARQRWQRRIIGGALAVFVVWQMLLTGITATISGDTANRTTVNGNTLSEYESYLRGYIASNVGDRLKITFNEARLADTFLRAFPEVAELELAIPTIGTTIDAVIRLREAAFSYSSAGELYVIDETGYVIESLTPDKAGSERVLKLPKIIDDSQIPPSIGFAPAVAATDIIFMQQFTDELSRVGVTVERVRIPQSARELYFEVTHKSSGAAFQVKASTERGVVEQGVDVGLLLDAVAPTDVKEYLDVRLQDKSFFR